MEFNHRIVSKIISDLEKARANKMPLDQLAILIEGHANALDSTFPKNLRVLVDNIFRKIHDLKLANYAANLNTDDEGLEEAGLRDSSFDQAISSLREFIGEQ